MFQKIPIKSFKNKKIYITPFNDNAIELHKIFKDKNININGFIDSFKKGSKVFHPDKIKNYDYIIIVKTRFNAELVKKFNNSKVILQLDTLMFYDHKYIDFHAAEDCFFKNKQVSYTGFYGNLVHEKAFILSTIKKFLLKSSKKQKLPKINIFYNDYFTESSKKFKNSINLCISSENIYFTFKQNKVWPNLTYFVENLCKKNTKNFAIVSNRLKSKNVLNFPFFFDTNLNEIKELIDIKKKKKYTNKKKFCAFIVSGSYDKNRINFCKKLMKYKKVDCYGKVLNNIKIPDKLIKKYKYNTTSELTGSNMLYYLNITKTMSMNQELFRDYKFVICFENSYSDDNITEKLPNVMMANSIGIYRGARNIGEFFNTKSFINYDDYENEEKIIEKIIELDNDEEKYQEMLQEPFFEDNKLPPRIKSAKKDLKKFMKRVVNANLKV